MDFWLANASHGPDLDWPSLWIGLLAIVPIMILLDVIRSIWHKISYARWLKQEGMTASDHEQLQGNYRLREDSSRLRATRMRRIDTGYASLYSRGQISLVSADDWSPLDRRPRIGSRRDDTGGTIGPWTEERKDDVDELA